VLPLKAKGEPEHPKYAGRPPVIERWTLGPHTQHVALANVEKELLRVKLVDGLAAAKWMGSPIGEDRASSRNDDVGRKRRIDNTSAYLAGRHEKREPG
jgi:hypothetical protein